MPVSIVLVPPNRAINDSSTFPIVADQFAAELVPWTEQVNEVEATVIASSETAVAKAGEASDSAELAATAATDAVDSADAANNCKVAAAESESNAALSAGAAANSAGAALEIFGSVVDMEAAVATARDCASVAVTNADIVTTKAMEASVSATASAVAAGVVPWVSGTAYAVGNVVFSPSSFQTYRRRSSGAGSIDPVSDMTNWEPISSGIQMKSVSLYGVEWNQSLDTYMTLSGTNNSAYLSQVAFTAEIATRAVTADTVTTNANLVGDITSVGNVTSLKVIKGVAWDQSLDTYTII